MRFLVLAALVACGSPTTPEPDDGCVYPDAPQRMTLNEPVSSYSWPAAQHADGRVAALDLRGAYCDNDPEIDWSPHDMLLFMSVPAW